MKKQKKSAIGPTVVLTTAGIAYVLSGGVAKANPYKDVWNFSWDIVKGQEVKVKENVQNAGYAPSFPREFRMYGWGPTVIDPTPHKLVEFGIDPTKTYLLEFRLEVETAPDGVNNEIYLNHWEGTGDSSGNPMDPEKRNFFMRQSSDSPRKGTAEEDSAIYDLLDLTNYFTTVGHIALPNITAATPRSPSIYDKWQEIISNYADLSPSVFDGNLPDGKVNFTDFAVFANYWQRTDASPANNWHKGADLDRDGNVDEIDLMKFAEQWLVDPNTIAKAIQFLPEQYRLAIDEKAREILDYKGKHNQNIVVKLYQNQSPTLSADIINRLSRNNGELELALNNEPKDITNNHYATIDQKLPTKHNQRILQTSQNAKKLYRA